MDNLFELEEEDIDNGNRGGGGGGLEYVICCCSCWVRKRDKLISRIGKLRFVLVESKEIDEDPKALVVYGRWAVLPTVLLYEEIVPLFPIDDKEENGRANEDDRSCSCWYEEEEDKDEKDDDAGRILLIVLRDVVVL